jgi:hypothetical protein
MALFSRSKEASLLGVPHKIRLRIYSLLFEAGTPIDTVTILARANATGIMGVADLVLLGQHDRSEFQRADTVSSRESRILVDEAFISI